MDEIIKKYFKDTSLNATSFDHVTKEGKVYSVHIQYVYDQTGTEGFDKLFNQPKPITEQQKKEQKISAAAWEALKEW